METIYPVSLQCQHIISQVKNTWLFNTVKMFSSHFGDSIDVSQVHSQASLPQIPALASTHMSACPQLGVEPQLGCLCPSCSLGCISAPHKLQGDWGKSTLQNFTSSLILQASHKEEFVGSKAFSRIQVCYTLSWTLLLALWSHHENSSTHYLLFIIGGLFST